MAHARLAREDHSGEWPAFLQSAKQKTDYKTDSEAPLVVHMGEPDSERKLKELVGTNPIINIIDNYDEQFAELQLSLDAFLYRANETIQVNSIKEKLHQHYDSRKSWELGAWVYYPWRQELVHVLAEEEFTALRTIRNRDLITSDEQKTLYDFPVACVGMSVGSASALSLVLSGISRRLKVADSAVISGSNLNRIQTGVNNVGLEKSLVITRMAYEMNPFMSIRRFAKVTRDSLEELFDKPWPVSAIIDEIDDLEIKIRLRLEAKKRRLAVIMATELADAVMLDVERFDQDPNRPLFHGLVPGIEKILERKDMNHREWQKHAAAIIQTKNMPVILQKSLLKIGSSIVTHPQLGSTVLVTGGVTTYAVKRIALGQKLSSGRTNISLDNLLVPEHNKLKHRMQHRRHTKILHRSLDAM
ncbi:MAG: ThiF family adenylyltransferase [Candidatus Saccharimonadales bacterium]